jgi:hypothetical protein
MQSLVPFLSLGLVFLPFCSSSSYRGQVINLAEGLRVDANVYVHCGPLDMSQNESDALLVIQAPVMLVGERLA